MKAVNKMDLMKVFNKKRTNSEYLKYEDGEIITIEKVSSNPDNAPRLEINKDIPSNTATVNQKPRGFEDDNIDELDKRAKGIHILKLVVGGILLLSLLGYVISLSLTFIDKTQSYVSGDTTATQQTDKNTQAQQGNETTAPTNSQTSNSSSNTNTNTNTNANTNINSSGSISGGKQDTVQQPVNLSDLSKLLQTVVNTHGTIYSTIGQSKTSVVSYMNKQNNLTVISSQMNRSSMELQQLYTSLQSKKDLFTTYNAQNLYTILLERLDNSLDLVKNLNNNTDINSMVSVLNDHIVKENGFLDKQNTELKSVLDKNSIKYTNSNGQLSWTISGSNK
jgi:hypothetical protein